MNEGMVLKIEWLKSGRREYVAVPNGFKLSAQPLAHDPSRPCANAIGSNKLADELDATFPVGKDVATRYGLVESWVFSLVDEGAPNVWRHIGDITTYALFEARRDECRDKCAYEMRDDCAVAYLMCGGRTIDVFK